MKFICPVLDHFRVLTIEKLFVSLGAMLPPHMRGGLYMWDPHVETTPLVRGGRNIVLWIALRDSNREIWIKQEKKKMMRMWKPSSNDDTSDSGVASAMPQLLWVSLRFSFNGTYTIYSKHLKWVGFAFT